MKKFAFLTISFTLLFFLMMNEGYTASVKEQISFGALMAKKGNWKEAIFRWEKALKKDTENYRLHNNIAVAYEALGKYEKADKFYQLALKYGKNNKRILENYNLFRKLYAPQKSEEKTTDQGSQGPTR
jgi:Tfp pilus assembly protein PilF